MTVSVSHMSGTTAAYMSCGSFCFSHVRHDRCVHVIWQFLFLTCPSRPLRTCHMTVSLFHMSDMTHPYMSYLVFLSSHVRLPQIFHVICDVLHFTCPARPLCTCHMVVSVSHMSITTSAYMSYDSFCFSHVRHDRCVHVIWQFLFLTCPARPLRTCHMTVSVSHMSDAIVQSLPRRMKPSFS